MTISPQELFAASIIIQNRAGGGPRALPGEKLVLGGIRQHGLGVRGRLAASTVSTSRVLGPLRLVLLSPPTSGTRAQKACLAQAPGSSSVKVAGPGCLVLLAVILSVTLCCPWGPLSVWLCLDSSRSSGDLSRCHPSALGDRKRWELGIGNKSCSAGVGSWEQELLSRLPAKEPAFTGA